MYGICNHLTQATHVTKGKKSGDDANKVVSCLPPNTNDFLGNGSFRPRVVSALSRRPGSFRPGSIRPWVVSAQFGGSFRPYFS